MASDTDHDIMEKLRNMLLSRDTDNQLFAADYIYKSINRASNKKAVQTELLDYLISSNMCVYLAEASATLSTMLLRKIVSCLQLFSDRPSFDKCSYVVAGSLIRALQLHIKEDGDESIILYVVTFLYKLFSKVEILTSIPILSIESTYDSIQILNLLKIIIEIPNVDPKTVLVASKMLLEILPKANDVAQFNMKILPELTLIFIKYLTLICNMFISSVYKLSKNELLCSIFGLMCSIGIGALNICNIITKKYNECSSETSTILKEDILIQSNCIKEISDKVYNILSFIIEKIKDFEQKIDIVCYEILLRWINIFFHAHVMKDNITAFAIICLNSNVLIFLGRLRTVCIDQELRKLCQMNLAELLVILSYENFDLSNWEGGKLSFRSHIYEGLLSNNDDLNTWPLKLCDNYASDATLNALITFLYFYCRSPMNSQDLVWCLLPHIVYYIVNFPKNKHCPFPIIQSLWLIFAMASSFGADISIVIGGKISIERANSKMVKLISNNIKHVYTHHVSILQWAYSSIRVPFSFSIAVLGIWLENEKTIPSDLQSNSIVWWSLLDIIQNGNYKIAQSARDLLNNCIVHKCNEFSAEKIKVALWESLPNMLTYHIQDNKIEHEEPLLCLMAICNTHIPMNPDLDVVKRTAMFLTEGLSLVNENNYVLLYHFLESAFNLLNVSLKEHNTNVLSWFINSELFIDTIYNATNSSNNALSTIAYKTISFAAHYKNIYNINCIKTILFDPLSLVKSLKNEKDDDKCCVILQIFFTSFNIIPQGESPTQKLISLQIDDLSEHSINILRCIFFRLQMICCKESKEQSQNAWECLNAIILFTASKNEEKAIKAIVFQPWTHTLIKFYIVQNKPHKSHSKFLRFVMNWLSYQYKIRKESAEKNNQSNVILKKGEHFYNIVSLIKSTYDDGVLAQQEESKRILTESILSLIKKFTLIE